MKPTMIVRMLCAMALFASTGTAHAVTECNNYVREAFVGSDGLLWITFSGNQTVWTKASGPEADRVFSTVMTALAGKLPVKYRLVADGVSCTSTAVRSDLAGLWIYAP